MKRPAKAARSSRHLNERLRDTPKSPPLISYMRVSKADGSQVLDLQRDALLAAGVTERHIYGDTASGSKDELPGLASCLQSLARATLSRCGSSTGSGAISGISSTPCTISRPAASDCASSPARAR